MTPLTKSLDETAGKQPWSEKGLKLLVTLQKLADGYVNGINERGDKCTKPNCAFCQWFDRFNAEPIEQKTIILQSTASENVYSYFWSEEEIECLIANIDKDIYQLQILLPKRSRAAIMHRRKIIRIRLRLKPLRRGGNRHETLNKLIKEK